MSGPMECALQASGVPPYSAPFYVAEAICHCRGIPSMAPAMGPWPVALLNWQSVIAEELLRSELRCQLGLVP